MQNINIKLQLFLTKEQEEVLDGHSKICNYLYNNLLETANNLKKEYIETANLLEKDITEKLKTRNENLAKTLYGKYGLRNLIPELKQKSKFLNVVYASPLKNTALRLSQVIKDFQNSKKGKRKGVITGWPKFRKWKYKWFSLYYDEPYKGYKIENGKLKLSLGLGLDRKVKSLKINIESYKNLKTVKVKNLRIIKEHNIFYAVITAEKIFKKAKEIKNYITLDPNHINLAWGVDNFGNSIEIKYPGHSKKLDKEIDKVKSKRDKCNRNQHKILQRDDNNQQTGKYYYKPSRQWLMYDTILKKIYKKRQEQTKHFLYTLANALCARYDSIAIGDYTPNGGGINTGMRRSMNNQSLIGRFKQILSWVAYKSGKQYSEYNERNTTKTCSTCDNMLEKSIPPNIREWQCNQCSANHHRDENAAINGFKKVFNEVYLRSLRQVSNWKRCAWSILYGTVSIQPST